MKRYVVLKFSFEDFLFSFPFGTISYVCRMITIAIGTFYFIFAILILMTCLSAFCTFLLIFAEFFVVAILLTIEASLGIWYINFCASNEKPNFDFFGDFLAIYSQNIRVCGY